MDGDFSKTSTLQGRVILVINNRCILWLLKSHKYLLAQGFIHDLQKREHLQQLEGCHLPIEGIRKGNLFCQKWYVKGYGGGGGGKGWWTLFV